MLVNVFILPLSPLQKHRNFQRLPYKIKSKVSVSYYDVLFQHSLLVLAVPGWCCEVRRSVMCSLVIWSICVTALSGVFLGKSSIKVLAGFQKLKTADNSAVGNICASSLASLFSICVCSHFPFPCHHTSDLEIRFLYVSPSVKHFIITATLTGQSYIKKVNNE